MSEALEFKFPPAAPHLRAVRRHLVRELERRRLPSETVGSVALIVDELVSNAIDHGANYRSDDSQLRLLVEPTATEVWLNFEDPDVPADLVAALAQRLRQPDAAPPLDAERGRGLYLITQFFAELSIEEAVGPGLRLRGRVV